MKCLRLAVLLFLLAGGMAGVQAQTTEAPPKPALLEKYKQLLEKQPVEGTALDRLWELYGKHFSTRELIAEYRKRAEADPANAKLQIVVGLLEKKAGHPEAAAVELQKAVELAAEEPLAWQALADVQLALGGNADAVKSLEKALALAKSPVVKIPLYEKLGHAHSQNKDWKAATEAYEKISELDPDNVQTHLQLARTYEEINIVERSLAHYEAVVKLGESFQRCTAYRQIGLLWEKQDRFDEARAAYESGLQLTSYGNWLRQDLQRKLVQLYERQGRLPELISKLRQQIQAEPGNLDPRWFLADIYASQSDLDRQIEVLNDALSIASNIADLRKQLADAYRERNNYEEAAVQYAELFRLEGRYLEHAIAACEMWVAARKHGEATKFWKKALSEHGPDVDWYLAAAQFHSANKLPSEAVLFFNKALEIDPHHMPTLLALGEHYYNLKQTGDAVAAWKRLVVPSDKEDTRLEQQTRLAELLKEHGLHQEAAQVWEEIVKRRPNDAVCRLAHGRQCLESGDPEKARAQFEKAMSLNGDLAFRLTVLDALLDAIEQDRQQENGLAGYAAEREKVYASDRSRDNILILSRIYGRQKKWSQSFTAMENYLADHAGDVQVLKEFADVASRIPGKHDRAEAVWNKLRQLDPGEERSYLKHLVRMKLDEKRSMEAVQYAKEIVDLNPQMAASYIELADAYQQAHQPSAAIEQVRVAVQKDPANFDYRRKLADMYQKFGRYDEAEAELTGMLSMPMETPVRMNVLQDIMSLALKRSRLDDLAQNFRKKLEENPDDYFLHLANAEILRVVGDDRGSYGMLQNALKHAKEPAEALSRLVEIAYEEDNLKEAIRYQQRLMRLARDPSASSYLKLAELQEEADDTPAAEETWGLISRRFKDDEVVLRAVASHFREKEADNATRETYERILVIDPSDYATWIELAKLSLKSDNKKKAVDCFQKVLSLSALRHAGTELILPPLSLVGDPSLWSSPQAANDAGRGPVRARPGAGVMAPTNVPRTLGARHLSRGGLFSNSPSIDLRKPPASLEEARLVAIAHLVSLMTPQELAAWAGQLEKERQVRTAVRPEDVPKNQELILFYVLTQNKEKGVALLSELSFAQPGNYNLRKFFLHAAAVWNRMDAVATFLQEHTPNGLPPREGLYEVIDLLISLGNSREALSLAQQFIEKYPDIETHSELVHIFADRQRYVEAVQLARLALQKNPSGLQSMHYRSWLVEWLLLMGQSEEASKLAGEVVYRDVVDLISDQDSKVRVLRQVPFLFSEQEISKMMAELPDYMERHSTPIDRSATLGILYTVFGDDQKAAPHLAHAATLKGDSLDFLREASMWFEQQRYSGAAKIFWDASKVSLQKLPESDVVVAQIKDIERREWEYLLQMGSEEEVNQRLDAILKDPATDERVLQDLAAQLRNYQYLEQSASVWQWLINRSPDNAAYKQQLIIVYQQTGDFDKAIQLWKTEIARIAKAFQGNENHPEVEKARLRLFDVYEQAGLIDELQVELEAQLKQTPDDPDLLKRLMRAYQQTNNEPALAVIREKLNRISRLQPAVAGSNDVEYMIYHYQNQGNIQAALDEAERIYRREPAKRELVLPILINLYFQANQQDKAMRLVRRLQAKQASNQLSRIYQTVGYQLQSKAKWDDAVRIWRAAAESAVSIPEAYQYQMRLVDIYLNHLTDFKAAESEIEQLENSVQMSDTGQLTEVIQMRVQLEERRSNLKLFAEKLEKKLKDDPDDEMTLWSLVQVYQRLGMFEPLGAIVERLIALHSEDEVLLQQLAGVLKNQRQWKNVEKIFRQMIQRQPQNVYYYTELAGALLSDNRKDEAEKVLRRVEQLGGQVSPCAQIAQFYLGRQMWDEANRYFEKALAESRGFRSLYVYQQYAESLARQRQYEKARDIYKRIFSFPQGRQYYYNLFSLYREWGRMDVLLTDFGPEIKKMPFMMKQQLYQQLILGFKEQGDLLRAIRLFEEQPIHFTDPYLYQNVGEAYDGLQQYEKAAIAFQEAVTRQPNNQQWIQRLADTYWKWSQQVSKTGDQKTTETLLIKACKLQPINQQYHFELARLYETGNEPRKAIQVYRDLADVTLSPSVKKSCEEQILRLEGSIHPSPGT